MNDHKKPVPGVEATANPIPSQGRRRLVKGMIIGTPAIFMVRNGYSQAITSLRPEDALSRICSSLSVTNTISLASFLGHNPTENEVNDFLNQCSSDSSN